MKKLLITLTILFSIFLFTDKVSAYCSNYPKLTSSNAIAMNTYGYTKEEVLEIVNKGFYSGGGVTQTNFIINSIFTLRNYYETNLKNDYKYYFISYSAVLNASSSNGYAIPEFRLNVFNESDIDSSIKDYVLNSHNHYNEDKKAVLGLNINSVVNKTYLSYSTGNNYNQLNYSKIVENVNYVINVTPSNSGSNFSVYYETNYNTNLFLNENNTSNIYNSLSYDGITYLPGQYVFNTKDGLGVPEVKPKIEVSEIDATYINVNSPLEGQSFKTSAKYNISFTKYDESIYDYYYSLDNTEWIKIYNNYELNVVKNGTYYIKIVDKENNIVTITSLDITQLKSLDYVKVKFDISEDSLINYGYSLDYIAITQNVSDYFKIPYYEILYDSTSLIYYNEQFPLMMDSPNIVADLSNYDNIKYYNFVIDLKNYYDNLDFTFNSNSGHNFEIVYYFSNGQVLTTALEEYVSVIPESSNFITIDLSDVKGVSLYPKVVDNSGGLATYYNKTLYSDRIYPIYLFGEFNIYQYDYNYDRDKTFSLAKSYKGISDNYYYLRSKYNYTSYYKIEKTQVDPVNYITFDSNLYDYSIIYNDSDDVILKNPITGEDINIGSLNDTKVDDEFLNNSEDNNLINNSTFFGLFKKAFNYFVEPISSFLSLIKVFFSVLPLGIQYMFYVSFGFLLALIIYKFVI